MSNTSIIGRHSKEYRMMEVSIRLCIIFSIFLILAQFYKNGKFDELTIFFIIKYYIL